MRGIKLPLVSSITRVKNPTKRRSEIVRIIDDCTDMNHLDNIFLFLILNLKIGSFNMLCTVGWMMSIDNVDTGFIVFINYRRTNRRLSKAFKDMENKEKEFSGRDSRIKFRFSRTKWWITNKTTRSSGFDYGYALTWRVSWW